IASAGFVSGLAVQLLIAPLADRGGAVLLGALALGAGVVGTLWFIFAASLAPLVAARVLLGCGLGLFDVVARKALVGLTTEGSGARLGTYLSASVGGFLLGPLLGAALQQFGFHAPFVAVLVLTIVAAGPALLWLHGAPIATVSTDQPASMLQLARRPGIRAAMLGQSVIFANIGIFDAVIDLYLEDLGAGNTTIGIVLLLVGAPLLVLPTMAGNWVEHIGPRRVLVPLLCAAGPAIAGFGMFPVLATIAVAGLVQGSIESFVFPTTQLLALDETGPQQAAAGQAVLGMTGLTAAGTTALLAPSVYASIGARPMFAAMGSLSVVAAVLAARQVRLMD
ncbi:MAG: MFS transporter, partial [Acidimicrobiales bacterium]